MYATQLRGNFGLSAEAPRHPQMRWAALLLSAVSTAAGSLVVACIHSSGGMHVNPDC